MSARNPRHPSRAPAPPAKAAPPARSRWFDQPGIALIPVLLLTRVLLWFYQPLANEDAYITFRFAEKLAAGHGLVYNDGERVMGFTSLPWTLWCALGVVLRVDPVVWTRLI